MTLPAVSIVVPTYARTTLLVEVVECFRRLTYAGTLELVILNDCPLQTLRCDVPGVVIINAPTFPTFGHKVNALFSRTSHDLIMRCDDDDLFLPDTVSSLVTKLETCEERAGRSQPVVRFRKMLQWTGGDDLRVRSCSVHHGALIRKAAWKEAGGLPLLSAGYPDVAFWDRMTPRWFVGRWHHEMDGHLLNIHRADTGRPHMEGADRVTGHPPLSERQFQDAGLARINIGEEPSGVVDLIPSWSRDWQAMADAVQKVSRE